MKNNIKTLMLAGVVSCFAAAIFSSCNDEWKDEQYAHYISFKAPLDTQGNSVGVTTVYVPLTRYDESGAPLYGAEGITSYDLPILVAGSTDNDKDLNIRIAVDPDTLNNLNYERFNTRKDLYYTNMADFAKFDSIITIPAGQNSAILHITLDLRKADYVNRYVLPLTIVDTDENGNSLGYERNPRKNYAKALLRILPYSYFSGSYESPSIKYYLVRDSINVVDKDGNIVETKEREEEKYYMEEDGDFDETTGGDFLYNVQLYAIDDYNVFFYAGNNDETRLDRKNYKVYAKFQYEEGSTKEKGKGIVTFWAENPDLEFLSETSANFKVTSSPDPKQPFLIRRVYTIKDINYYYTDYTMAQGAKLKYHVKGNLTMERALNTQKPEEDQIEW